MKKLRNSTGFYFKGLQLMYKTKKGLKLKITNITIALILLSLLIYFPIRIKLYSNKILMSADLIEQAASVMIQEENTQEIEEEPIYTTEIVEVQKETKLDYKLTSYYSGDGFSSGSTTASGKKTSDFKINENGWYTYDGKLVIATASKRLLKWDQYKNSTQKTYNLYDELILEINGIRYDAIVLDVCGAAMKKPIIDLFVSSKSSVITTNIKVISNI